MIFTNIFSKWKESLDLFKKESFKLFLLVGLNNAKRSTIIFLSKFWWLLFLVLGSFIGGLFSLLGKDFVKIILLNKPIVGVQASAGSVIFGLLSLIVMIISSIFLIYITFLIVRPSIEAKDSFYFKKHLKRIFGFCFLMFFAFFINFLIVAIIGAKAVSTSILFKLFAGFLGIIFSLTVFFFLDSQKKLSSVFVSIFKALKAFIYFFPVFIFLQVVSLFFNSLFYFLLPLIKEILIEGTVGSVIFGIFITIIYTGFSLVVVFFNLSLIVNYYTMLKHKYYKLLYK